MRRMRKALLPALVLAFSSPGHAATITVPADRPTVQAAVDAAGAGDTILVQPGTYVGAVRIGHARHGLVISAADPADPPVLQDDHRRGAVVTIAGVDDVKLDSLAIQGPAPGVSVENARGAQLLNLEISGTGTAIRIRGGGLAQIVDCDVTGTRAGQGIRIERSRDVLVSDVTLDGTRREGLLVRGTTGLTVLRTVVTNARGRAGIKLVRSPDANLAECVATDNRRHGIQVQRSESLGFRDNDAEGNRQTGLRVERSDPFFSLADLATGGNQASANGGRDMLVIPPRCGRRRCRHGSTTTTTSLPAPRVTTTTGPGLPGTVTTTTATTTSMTTTSGPLSGVHFRLYIRIDIASGGVRDFDVPLRSIEAPLAIGIRPEHADAFRVDDQVTGVEIGALGSDTLARLVNAATTYAKGHPTDYPPITGSVELEWAKRVP